MADLSSGARPVTNPPHSLWAPALPLAFDLEGLQKTVATIEAVLKDAEEREIDDEAVRLWLRDLRGVACEADDVLDDCEYETLRAEAEAVVESGAAAPRPPHKRRRHGEVGDDSAITSPLDAVFLRAVAVRVQKIQRRLEEISKLRDGLHLREGDGRRCSQNIVRHLPRSHLLDVANPRGRKDDLGKLISILLSDECSMSDLFVIPIVGMGGVGKTTLAQLVYNNSEVCRLFQLHGWVSVSDDFDLIQLNRKIVEVFTTSECKLQELSTIQRKLIDEIKGKRFLLVLDEVWNEDPSLWKSLLLSLKHGKQGCAVIATTRSKNVATIMAPRHHVHCLNCLSREDCWEVFKQNAFDGRDVHEEYPELVEIGKQIAEKCKGLPLAAKSLGCLLSRCDHEVETWRNVLESHVWDVDDTIIPVLMLSYLHLPSHLKQCFLYASLFPKNYDYNKDEMVQLWMAQGFIRQQGSRDLENVGGMYFDELLKRSFFQHSPGDPPLFVMHDLLRDLARYISRGEHIAMEMGMAGSLCLQDAHHLSVQGIHSTSSFDLFYVAPEALRTVLILPPVYCQLQEELALLARTVLVNLKSLRVLSLRGASLCWLPESIGDLKHLRYLSLEDNAIGLLPDSVGKLYHLQTLILIDSGIKRLPTGVKDLLNLRCLKVGTKHGRDFTQMRRGIGRMKNLRSLDVLSVGKVGEDCGVEELRDLKHLRGRLTICNLSTVVDAGKAKEASLESKTKLWCLNLSWYCDNREWVCTPEFSSHDQHKQVLENLQPHCGLKHLTIDGYCGLVFPEWVGDPCFSRLAIVKLLHCRQLIALPPLGRLPSLRHLEIREGVKVKVLGSEFRGPGAVGFPALEELVLASMSSLTAWQGARKGDFPRLRRLEVSFCERLKSIAPLYHLPALEELVLCQCGHLASIRLQSSSSSCRPMPPLKLVKISGCPQAYFLTEDGGQPWLPPTLHNLAIDSDCLSLVEWCQRDSGIRLLSGIPGIPSC